MAVLTLPTLPRQTDYELALFPEPRELSSPTGDGVDQRIAGFQRHILTVTIPAVRYDPCGAALIADLSRATDKVALVVPEPGVTQDGYGTPLVNGASQSGSVLKIDGLTNGVVIPKGKLLSISTNSRRYLYRTTAEKTANSSGEINDLPIWPPLRISPANNDAVTLNKPMIEGFATVLRGHGLRRIGATDAQFSIREVR